MLSEQALLYNLLSASGQVAAFTGNLCGFTFPTAIRSEMVQLAVKSKEVSSEGGDSETRFGHMHRGTARGAPGANEN